MATSDITVVYRQHLTPLHAPKKSPPAPSMAWRITRATRFGIKLEITCESIFSNREKDVGSVPWNNGDYS